MGGRKSMVKQKLEAFKEEMYFVAERYYDTYGELGGSISISVVLKDFLIVACASIKQMDVLVSNDNYTMLTENAMRAYNLINKARKIKTPQFIDYVEFCRRLSSL